MGTSVRHSGTEIGTIPAAGAGSGVNGNSLIVTLDADATPAIVDELLEALGYQNTSDTPTALRTVKRG